MKTTVASLLSLTLLALNAAPASAESSAASSVSNSASSTASSASNSIEGSSKSSSGKDQVAAGDYKVIEMAALPTQENVMRVRLQAVAEGSKTAEVVLLLPRAAAAKGEVAEGQVLRVAHKDYGLAIANATKQQQQQPFFLVLDDAWFRELQSRPV